MPDIEQEIAHEYHFTAFDGVVGESIEGGFALSDHTRQKMLPLALVAYCVLVLKDGSVVSADAENTEAARQAAVQKIQRLHEVEA